MKKQFDIKFLSDEDFDNMPIADRLGEDVSDSLGIYNPYTNQIRIRDTKIWEVNKYLLDHELEHAVEDHATDEGPNGLRHKKFFKEIVAPLFTGVNLETKKFSPFGILDSSISKKAQQEKEAQKQASQFGGLGFGPQLGNESNPVYGSSISPYANQSGQQGSLNTGLSQQSVNPLLDPYSKYGQQSGRILNF